jgi:hypothetical protein
VVGLDDADRVVHVLGHERNARHDVAAAQRVNPGMSAVSAATLVRRAS